LLALVVLFPAALMKPLNRFRVTVAKVQYNIILLQQSLPSSVKIIQYFTGFCQKGQNHSKNESAHCHVGVK